MGKNKDKAEDGATRPAAASTNDLVTRRLLYPINEVAKLLGCHRTTLYQRAREGSIELVKIGGRTYATATEIDRYVAKARPVQVQDRSA